MAKFVIFAHARTGSTSLARVLAESKDVKMASEPFHPGFSKWNPKERNYSKLIKDKKTMNDALDELFRKYSAIKVLDYQFPKKIYFEMLGRKDLKFLFLRRKNLLEAAISTAVGEQTKEWHKQGNQKVYDNLKPVDIDEIAKWIKYIGKLSETYFSYLEKNRSNDFLPLYYEDLYSEDLENNRKTLKAICDFLDITLPPDVVIEKYMTPSKAKINYKNIYSRIPNYQEIMERFKNI